MKLVIFDCDGTLVDSQHGICTAMERTFAATGLDYPGRERTMTGVGLSLHQAMQRLVPDGDDALWAGMTRTYKEIYHEMRQSETGHPPLYDGAREIVDGLSERDDILLAVATGKSQRGMREMLDHHDWHGRFISIQTADDAPSKPHPAMVHQAIHDAGVTPAETIMIGDTTYDIIMARAARAGAIGVSWGYHLTDDLRMHGSHAIVDSFAQLPDELERLWSEGW